jgi:hypothetical protein
LLLAFVEPGYRLLVMATAWVFGLGATERSCCASFVIALLDTLWCSS